MGYEKNYGNVTSESTTQVTLSKVYGWITLALIISTVSALYTAKSEALLQLIYANQYSVLILFGIEIALVWFLSARINKLSFGTAFALFLLYSVINGVFLSFIFLVYSMSSIYAAFFSTALTFGAMSVIGYTTKKDLSSLGSYLMMGVIGLIIASLVNMFLNSDRIDYIITYAGLVIFIGLTAYDTQKIKKQLAFQDEMSIDIRKIALMGALSLYLDFVNLFLYILRLLGGRRD